MLHRSTMPDFAQPMLASAPSSAPRIRVFDQRLGQAVPKSGNRGRCPLAPREEPR